MIPTTSARRPGLHRLVSVAVLAGAPPAPLLAEVMDKEPSLASIWLWAVLGLVGAVWLGRTRPLLGLFAALVFGRNALVAVVDWHDPMVGPAMLEEAGASYGFQAHTALGLLVFAIGAGMVLWYRDRSRRGRRSAPA